MGEKRIQVPEQAEKIIEQLNRHGYEACVVGGCVRDSLLGRTPEDWDITTSAVPQEVKALFKRTVDTGIQHGTVTVMQGKEKFEVTTYRIDGEYKDGRHPQNVAFTSELAEDLKRRDFTINAMAYSGRTGLVDLFGGLKDLENGVIRCVGRAEDRFGEDALRILRAIRFSAQMGFGIEEETWAAICMLTPKLVHVSKERIQMELTKLLLSDRPETIKKVFQCGMAPYITDTFSRIAIGSLHIPAGLPRQKHIRWSAFLRCQSPEEAAEILKDLKLDNDTIGKVKLLVTWWRRPVGAAEPEIRRTMSQMPAALFDDLRRLKRELLTDGDNVRDNGGTGEAEQVPETLRELKDIETVTAEIRRRGDCISLKTLAVSGSTLISLGMKPGRQIGEALDMLLQMVIKDPQANTKAKLTEALTRQGYL